MSKFRVSAHDAPERLPTKPDLQQSGKLPASRVAVVIDGQRRGHISARTGSAATALRLGAHKARLGRHDGAPAWIGISGRGSINADKLAGQRRQAKGSVSKNPTRPETSARPKR